MHAHDAAGWNEDTAGARDSPSECGPWRTKESPRGWPGLSEKVVAYLEREEALVAFSTEVLRECQGVFVEAVLENPAPRDDTEFPEAISARVAVDLQCAHVLSPGSWWQVPGLGRACDEQWYRQANPEIMPAGHPNPEEDVDSFISGSQVIGAASHFWMCERLSSGGLSGTEEDVMAWFNRPDTLDFPGLPPAHQPWSTREGEGTGLGAPQGPGRPSPGFGYWRGPTRRITIS